MYLSSVTVDGFRAGAVGQFACTFPDRFSVLVGQNNAGKTTVSDALYLAHVHTFPSLRRPSAAVLGENPRTIDVEFEFGGAGAEGPLGSSLLARSEGPPRWTRRLERSLGSVRAVGVEAGQHVDDVRLIYLPANRNPVDELARREAEVLIELLRAEQERQKGHRNLADVRGVASHLLEGLVTVDLIRSVEGRVSEYLRALSGGVSQHHAFVGSQEIDDAFLARVLEFLLAAVDQRVLAQRLVVSGLGYVNLLHIAVTLAAIPGGSAIPSTPSAASTVSEPPTGEPDAELPEGHDRIEAADAEADAIEDSFFPEVFHATVVIEEPDSHLHPQLQHGLMRYLRRVTQQRPELQVIVTTHSSEMMTACRPEDLVVLRRDSAGSRVSRPVANLPLPSTTRDRVLRLAALHFDASRSASLFAERVVLVEGVTDALVVRHFGHAWASSDSSKHEFVDALTIVPVGSRVGEWPVQLLASPGYELASRVAILRDTDKRDGTAPEPPTWVAAYDDTIVQCFLNHPTLEPAVTVSNEALVGAALASMAVVIGEVTPDEVDDLFHNGAGKARKGEFAFALAAGIEDAIASGTGPAVPQHLSDMFDFLYSQPATDDEGEDDAAATAD